VVRASIISAALFALVYFPAITVLARGLVSPYAKADVRKRLLAATMDGLLFTTAWFLYRNGDSVLPLASGAAYLALRDSRGQSVGKFCMGLVVISLATGRPCTLVGSVRRNLLLVLPGANAVAVVLETATVLRDPQGQRLGDRLAQTQVVEGFGVKDLAASIRQWWRSFAAELDGDSRRRRRRPVEVETACTGVLCDP
jgi:uncharacterized RDD family membrane protein YckC